MKLTLLITVLIFFCSCGKNSMGNIQFTEKIYVTAQGYDQVNILTNLNGSILDDQEIITFNYIESLPDNPHFVEIDIDNGVWFTTVINSGFVVMCDLETNEIIASVQVGDSPALMAHNPITKKLYVSRMMPMAMMGMGSESNIIQILDYSSNQLNISGQYDIASPSPHGIAISSNGNYIFTVSTTTDWLYKINTTNDEITSTLLNSAGNGQSDEINYLKPIHIKTLNNYIVISCSAGKWYNSTTGENIDIPGSIKLLNIEDLSTVAEYEFDWFSSPWHIETDNNTNEIFVSLGGDSNNENSAGVVCLEVLGETLSLKWKKHEYIYQTLHGIVLSENSDVIYVSGRGDGHLHILSRITGNLINSIAINMIHDHDMDGMNMGAMLGGIAIRNVE